jgi:hypothetical protein
MTTFDPKFLGPIVTSVGICVSVTLWTLNLRRKELSYEIVSDDVIVGLQDANTTKAIANPDADLEILVHGESVKNVRHLTVRIANSGHLPIRPSEFDGSIRIKLGPSAKILSATISETYPSNLEERGSGDNAPISLISKVEDGKLLLRPVLLNGKDFVVVKILVKDGGNVEIDSHIEGIKDIKYLKESNSLALALTNGGAFVMAICLFYLNPVDMATNNFVGYLPFLFLFLIGYNMLFCGLNFAKINKLIGRRAHG